ncbi:cyclic lactone autoinducer peptide [Clostridium intestinale DSM 6191]|uniref:Cyclic lactone autoinducer peptide n=2 Tax=Clostridium intestinale TaxID=36845 RepID=A0A1M5ZJI7_9CLOT|nr:cyclic lactone autoinducer peptide [Clostridium intestinale DSM 6191]
MRDMNKGLFEELKDMVLDGVEKASVKVAENSTSKCTYLLFYETKIPQELLREEE